jgi:aldehyde dehydrogenase (NAD+)
MSRYDNLINGQWTAADSYSPNTNPSDLSDVIGEYAQGGASDVQAAVAAAAAAFPAWSTSGIQARSDALDKIGTEILARKAELGELLAREEGKTLPEAIGEVGRAGQIFKFFAGECLRLTGETVPSVRPGIGVEITREPIGVVGLITPWNFPIAIPAWKIAPALAFGNCVVLKPADLVPGSAWALADIIHRSGIPAGVFNLVMGRGRVIGEALVNHADVAAISFTGSVAWAAALPKPASKRQEGAAGNGRQEPQIVLDDADLNQAVELSAQSGFTPRASAARHRAASSSPTRSTRPSSRPCRRAWPKSRSVTHAPPAPTWAPWSARPSWSRICRTWKSPRPKALAWRPVALAWPATRAAASRASTWRPRCSWTPKPACASTAKKSSAPWPA